MAKPSAPLPKYRAQLATLVDDAPSGERWVHELEYDGYRIGCTIDKGTVRLESPRGNDWTARFPEIVAAAKKLRVERALLDGEVAVVLPDGRTSFQALQNAFSGASRRELTYFVFDCLHLDGRNLAELPLVERKTVCEKLIRRLEGNTIRYSAHFELDGPRVFERACELGAEGIVSKRRDQAYRPGRNDGWLKTKCVKRKRERQAAVRGVTISSPERVIYPELGFTKLDLARFYAEIAQWMLPYVANRPLTLVRCEKGVHGAGALRRECKFLRHEPGWHRWAHHPIRRARIQERKKVGEYLLVDSPEGLVSLAQGDILEIHTWNSTTDDIERPDRIVFDLDPGTNVEWPRVVDAAVRLREELADLDLESWVKLTGGNGLHVVVPFRPELEWLKVYAFARDVAEALVRKHPGALTSNFERRGREQKILVDYKRNHRAAVAVAAFSARARPNGSVSAMLSWRDLATTGSSDAYTVLNVVSRWKRQRLDPWKDYWNSKQRLRLR